MYRYMNIVRCFYEQCVPFFSSIFKNEKDKKRVSRGKKNNTRDMIKLIECLFVSIANCSLRIVGKVSTQHAVEMYYRVKKKKKVKRYPVTLSMRDCITLI